MAAQNCFWAKKDRATDRPSLSLIGHSADVAACLEGLLGLPTVASRLMAGTGSGRLDPVTKARLCVFAALHDFGKANHGFQRGEGGHIGPAAAALTGGAHSHEIALTKGVRTALNAAAMAGWGRDEDDWCGYLLAALAHHGRPVSLDGRSDIALWTADNGIAPLAGVAELAAAARTWFPDAYRGDGPPLPAAAFVQHRFAGLVMLADWLGSTTDWFPADDPLAGADRIDLSRRRAALALAEIGLDVAAPRAALAGGVPGWSSLLGDGAPRPAQAAVDRIDLATDLVLLEAETGSGKTEAALRWFQRLFAAGKVDGLYFALPTRAAAMQMVRRVEQAVPATFGNAAPAVVTAVPGYFRVDGVTGQKGLAPFEVLWPDAASRQAPSPRGRFWAAEHAKRYLSGAVAVGTVDQVLLAGLAVDHSMMRTACLSRLLLVVDEVHASDTYMRVILGKVLDRHRAAGGYALAMSATLGSVARAGFFHTAPPPPLRDACRQPYPALTTAARPHPVAVAATEPEDSFGLVKQVTVQLHEALDAPETIAALAATAVRAGARVLVVRNTVDAAVAVQRALETDLGHDDPALFRAGPDRCAPAPHHARFAPDDRKMLDASVPRRFGRTAAECREPAVLVATQTVEQSLDIDADLLITDLCPMDVLLQRLGRLHRHPARTRFRPAGFEAPLALVLTPANDALAGWIGKDGAARGRHGFNDHVYADLRIVEATRRCLAARRVLTIPADNRELVESATHPDALEALTDALGGSWTKHRDTVTGKVLAHGMAAVYAAWDDRARFGSGDELFPDKEQRILSRLGANDRLLKLDREQPGPFGPVTVLKIPGWWSTGRVPPPDAANSVTASSDSAGYPQLTVIAGGQELTYDRHGLRRAGRRSMIGA